MSENWYGNAPSAKLLWTAPSLHTNPMFWHVDGQPFRGHWVRWNNERGAFLRGKQPQGDKWDVPNPHPDSPRSLSTSSSYFARIQREVFIYNPQLRHHITLILLLLSLYVWSFGSLKLTFPVIGKNIKLFEQSNVHKWSPLT